MSLNVADDAMADAAGIRQPREIMGALAIDTLSSLMQRNHRGFQNIAISTQVDGEWETGRTLGRRRPAEAGGALNC